MVLVTKILRVHNVDATSPRPRWHRLDRVSAPPSRTETYGPRRLRRAWPVAFWRCSWSDGQDWFLVSASDSRRRANRTELNRTPKPSFMRIRSIQT